MTLRLFPKHVLAFAVRGKRKVGSLYTPTRGSYADYFQHQAIWLADFGSSCTVLNEGATVGSKGYIIDAFELEDVPSHLWAEYVPRLPPAVVKEIMSEAAQYDGMITANVIHEDSIFALEETDRWETLPRTPAQPSPSAEAK